MKYKESNGDVSNSASSIQSSIFDHDSSMVTNAKQNGEKEVRRMTQKETEDVDTWRELVTGALIITAVMVTVTCFITLKQEQTSNFRVSFEQYALTVSESARFQENIIDETFATVGEMITTHAIMEGGVWPFVTLPYFELLGGHSRKSANTHFFAFSPVVSKESKTSWQAYSQKKSLWILDSWRVLNITDERVSSSSSSSSTLENYLNADNISAHSKLRSYVSPEIYRLDHLDHAGDIGPGPYAPVWQTSPPPPPPSPWSNTSSQLDSKMMINFDVLSNPQLNELYHAMVRENSFVYSDFIDPNLMDREYYSEAPQPSSANDLHDESRIQSVMFYPVYSTYQKSSHIVGILEVVIRWEEYISNLHPTDAPPMYYVLRNTCGGVYTFLASNENNHTTSPIEVLGAGDQHDIFQSRFVSSVHLLGRTRYKNLNGDNNEINGIKTTDSSEEEKQQIGQCSYGLYLYPTSEMQEIYRSDVPDIFTAVIAFTFFFISFAFFIYDKYVQKRNNKVIKTAARSTAIISSLFPSTFRDRLFSSPIYSDADETNKPSKSPWNLHRAAGVTRLRSYLSEDDDGSDGVDVCNTKPIADLFPETTVLFADIVGFTAWSSVREPSQVFTLLETLFRNFDQIAARRHVFKVETVGDCYVAVTGLPEPKKDHAVIMARFARECLVRVLALVKELEIMLGPDTGELSMRFGLHSGPVTAGVLRGDRSRFQLFGDTVNTASRMESTGERGKIHVSQETADSLISFGKESWIKKRADKVTAKGKGELTTYWLAMKNSDNVTVSSSMSDEKVPHYHNISGQGVSDRKQDQTLEEWNQRKKTLSARCKRLIDWNTDILKRLLKEILARRRASHPPASLPVSSPSTSTDPAKYAKFNSIEKDKNLEGEQQQTVLDEVKEIIFLPKFDKKVAQNQEDPESIQLSSAVIIQLRDYVTTIAAMYRNNPFHNFEHASHVTMSVVKLLSRIVAPVDIDYNDDGPNTSEKQYKKKILSQMHDHTYGINSDPLTQFSVILSALIHDVDHVGLPNATLVKEDFGLAKRYKGKSIAEQNSVDLAWCLLMSPGYDDLRSVIYCNEEELRRFRELVVNSVMATDIADKELKTLRNSRWDKAFDDSQVEEKPIARNRKATIIIEHLIQASDVSHTMQHWHIYRKWNERLFHEMYRAYVDGHSDTNPSTFWYKGELGFFDFYILPLAKKLKECGVFGVSSDEYLNYATRNREEWELRGKKVVADMLREINEVETNQNSDDFSICDEGEIDSKSSTSLLNTNNKGEKSFRSLA